MSHSFAVRNVTPSIFLPDVSVKASLWLKSVYFLCMTAAEWDRFGSVTKPTTRALLPMSRFYWPQCDCHCAGVWLRNKANVTVTFFREKSHIYFPFYYYLSEWQPKKRGTSFHVTVMQLRLYTSSWAPLVREKMQKKVINSLQRSCLSSRRLLPFNLTGGVPCYLAIVLWSEYFCSRGHLLHERGVDPPGRHWLLVKLPVEGSQGSQLRDSFTVMHSNISRCRQRDWNQKKWKWLVWIETNPILLTQRAFLLSKLSNLRYFYKCSRVASSHELDTSYSNPVSL